MSTVVNIAGHECQKLNPTIGNPVIDLSPLLKTEKSFFYDPGFMMTASCASKITYIDGDKGILVHRGYTIEDIVQNKSFLETAYLILNGEFPSNSELSKFISDLDEIKIDIDILMSAFNAIPAGNHPMATTMTLTSVLSGLRSEIRKTADNYWKCLDLIKHFVVIVSMAGCKFSNKEFKYSYAADDYAKSFAQMFLDPEITQNPELVDILSKILILHIDHEQNASTSTVRMIGSTKCDLYGAVVGGIAALWGPLHGGANEAVLKMLSSIGSVDNIMPFINKVKNKEDNAKLMGFGHRVYKNYDPRAGVLKSSLSKIKNIKSTELEIALKLEEIALNDDYFISRKLFPNVDFYSGIIYQTFGIPQPMFTPMFALARIVGWCAHWLESKNEEEKIWRPRQLYTGNIDKTI